MADFCVQCAEEMGFATTDLAGLTKEEDWANGCAALVICEGCGPIQVDPQGRCVSPDCLSRHAISYTKPN
jgi:hypothetical protein